LSSIISASCCPFATFILSYFAEGNTIGRSIFYTLLSLPMTALVVWMHRSNIERLKNGTERKFRKSKEA
jgi:glycerol-3-phosphate acyltransferase PlsY